ncbi:1259_t:CDS:1, partial [Racocetra persica]
MNKKEPKLEYFYWHMPYYNGGVPDLTRATKCSEFAECGEFINGPRHGYEKATGKRFCSRHCPLGDLYDKKYRPKRYAEHVKRCKER